MVIAFCTSCMNRGWQLKSTLASNLAILRDTPHFLALVDYNSSDDLETLIRAQEEHLRAGRLTTFRTVEPASFHASMAKNLAHRLALRRAPDVVFNLDADNFIRADTLLALEDHFARKRHSLLHNWSGRWRDGTFGRIALRTKDWVDLGGYDEELGAMSWQDADLMVRARAAGLSYVHDSCGCGRPVPNTVEQKLVNIQLPAELADATSDDALYQLHQLNFIKSLGRPIALHLNDQRRWGGILDFEQRLEI